MNILVKYPTRSRPAQFCECLSLAYNKATNPDKIEFIISVDNDDSSLQGIQVNMKNVQIIPGERTTKIGACNRDIERAKTKWDILVLLSDDMICQVDGWDEIIRQKFKGNSDKIVHFNDGYTGEKLCTMCILGVDYYARFGYIYNPEYVSLWCDNEFTEVAQALGKYEYDETVLFKHEHPMFTGAKWDNLMKSNQRHLNSDKKTYERRKANGFQ